MVPTNERNPSGFGAIPYRMTPPMNITAATSEARIAAIQCFLDSKIDRFARDEAVCDRHAVLPGPVPTSLGLGPTFEAHRSAVVHR